MIKKGGKKTKNGSRFRHLSRVAGYKLLLKKKVILISNPVVHTIFKMSKRFLPARVSEAQCCGAGCSGFICSSESNKWSTKHSYFSVNKTSPGKLDSENFQNFFTEKIVDYRAGAWPAILASWSWRWVKIERLHNTAGTPSSFYIICQYLP